MTAGLILVDDGTRSILRAMICRARDDPRFRGQFQTCSSVREALPTECLALVSSPPPQPGRGLHPAERTENESHQTVWVLV